MIINEKTVKVKSITYIGVSLRGTVEFCYAWHIESGHEVFPYLSFQAVTKYYSQLMIRIVSFGRSGQNIPTHFTDILSSLDKKNKYIMFNKKKCHIINNVRQIEEWCEIKLI